MMKRYRWAEVEKQQLTPAAARQMIHGDAITLARFELKKGASIPEHSHPNEQITTLESGRMRFQLGGEELILEPGESLHIPAHLPHSAEALENSVAFDVFSPPREDWIRGSDAYLRK